MYRKKLTHLGAVRCTHPLYPATYCCNIIGKCFDPSNAVYAMTLKAICPFLEQDYYNNETICDICEAWLATGMTSEIPACRSLAVGVDGIAAVLYIIALLTNVNTLQELDKVYMECEEHPYQAIRHTATEKSVAASEKEWFSTGTNVMCDQSNSHTHVSDSIVLAERLRQQRRRKRRLDELDQSQKAAASQAY